MLLVDPRVSARVAELIAKRSARTSIRADRVVAELAKIAFATLGTFLRIDDSGQPVFNLADVDSDALAGLAEFQAAIVSDAAATENEARHILKIRVKLLNKLRALELLGIHLGLFGKTPIQQVDTLAEAVRVISARGSAAPIRSGDGKPWLDADEDGNLLEFSKEFGE